MESQAPAFVRFAPTVRFAVAPPWAAVLEDFGRATAAAGEPSTVAEAATAAVGGATTVDEKVRALYAFLQRAVRPVDVDPDDCGFEVHGVAEVLQDNAGNGLDRNLLFTALLRAVGVDAKLVLTASEYVARPSAELTVLQQFDGAATLVGGRLYQAAEPTLPFGLLPRAVEGGWWLDLATGALAEVPALHVADNGTTTRAKLRLDERGDLSGTLHMVFRGYEAQNLKVFRFFTPQQSKTYLQQGLVKLHPALELVDFAFEGLDDDRRTVELDVTVRVAGYAEKAGPLLLFRQLGFPAEPTEVTLEKREIPMFWYDREHAVQTTTVELPAGYGARNLPKRYEATCAGASYTASYRSEPGQVVFDDWFERSGQTVEPEAYGAYKDFVEGRCRYSREWVVLERK